MLILILFSTLFFQINADSFSCPTNVTCLQKETCCETTTGLWACCPMESGVCCNDGLHCCPKDHLCLSNGTCHSATNQSSSLSFPLKDTLSIVSCPDGSSCPNGNTCCQISSGEYACCPLPDAVCCSDSIHCCPNGYECNVERGQCLQDKSSIPWATKISSIRKDNPIDFSPLKINTQIICPDATSLCPSTSTCCLTKQLTWGCCPIEKAVCCADHIHCCPTHYKCNLHESKCDHPLFNSIPLLKKHKSIKLSKTIRKPLVEQTSLSTIQCPDKKSYCPEETTCCQLGDGSYGCCPYAEASCCSDKIHCCEKGYSCDITSKRCIRSFIQPFGLLNPVEDILCPDGITQCSSTTTCCPNKDKDPVSYSCCPYAKGVCCGRNGSICCPNNYQCDETQLSCQLQDSKSLLRNRRQIDIDFHQCGLSDFGCSASQTCCRTYGSSDGDYACCNFPGAQCCEDGRHCCPKGTRCDTQYGGCIQE
ncbi:unnamed protein product [Adineta ricciae]|uniref:Granulins domain-containing protein n=1 Tax=Adineta ricciae TaxID=249248 RepID=A0A815G0I4_ADIRI|nr:unnamed protein product [Adineta ricciae]